MTQRDLLTTKFSEFCGSRLGLRGGVKVTIGGNAVNEDACKYVGADAWSKNAAEAVKVCGTWV